MGLVGAAFAFFGFPCLLIKLKDYKIDWQIGSDVMAESGSPQEQLEEGFEDEFGEIIKSRSGRMKCDLAHRLELNLIYEQTVTL